MVGAAGIQCFGWERKVLKLNKLRAKSNAYAKSFIYTDLSSLQITLNNEKEAMNCLDKAGKYSDQIKNRNFKQTVVLQKALLYVNQREWERAEFEMKSLIGQFMAGDSISIIIAAYNLLAYSLIKQYKVEEAIHAVRHALQESITSGDVLAKATSLWLLGDINFSRVVMPMQGSPIVIAYLFTLPDKSYLRLLIICCV